MNELHGKLDWVYMQDGARCHTSVDSIDWLEERLDVITDWPPNSPDLNPIELLWAIMKRIVAEQMPSTVEELKKLLEKTWNELDMELINKLCSGYVDSLRLCLEMEGQSISRFLGLAKDLKEAILKKRNYTRWTEEEDMLLHDLVTKIGHQWKLISQHINKRDPISCKNRWYTCVRKKQPEILEKN
ncbi:transposable element tc3 transposase [Histomonas meleagridis]|uniref:transposable element tc3 transposase n=1 Tax=Histomonas meleagridis TaxID=135588 RepID=UPI00355A3289|nr:transposable element tc3 transposase [Histomonas meleagridis]KAH0803689.1 transposable element tc3 transposase [Histomonas meleagridis]